MVNKLQLTCVNNKTEIVKKKFVFILSQVFPQSKLTIGGKTNNQQHQLMMLDGLLFMRLPPP